MKPLFISDHLQKKFDSDGFVHIPFLSSAQADELAELYKTIETEHQEIGIPFITTSHSNNHELIMKADRQIAGIFTSEMDKVLCDYKLLFGNFLIKQPGPESVTPPHQDITFVDETRYSSISVWVSLQDTNEKNGCMRFVKGSHKFRPTLRPVNAYPWPYSTVKDKLEGLLTDYPSKKGEAFIFHHGVIHASYANLTSSPRVAALMAAYPADAELLLFFYPEGSKTEVDKYKMTKEAYLHFIKGVPPAMGELLGSETYNFEPVKPADFERILNTGKSFMQKFAERMF